MKHVLNLYAELMLGGQDISPRGSRTKELLSVDLAFDPDQWFISFPDLDINLDYVRHEFIWYIKGKKEDLSICEHASIWKDMVHGSLIESNYGYYFNKQMWEVYDELAHDKFSRRAVVNINQPEHLYPGAKDVPCTISMHYMVRRGCLDVHITMRSQDAVYGLRNDLPAFQMFKLRLAALLELPPGKLFLHVNSMHVYERHFDIVAEVVNKNQTNYIPGIETVEQLRIFLDADSTC